MNAEGTWLLKDLRVVPLLFPLILAQQALCADLPVGKVVWWGRDVFPRATYSEHTNGVIEIDNEMLTNVVAIATRQEQVLALKNDSTVISTGFGGCGWNDVPNSPLKNRSFPRNAAENVCYGPLGMLPASPTTSPSPGSARFV